MLEPLPGGAGVHRHGLRILAGCVRSRKLSNAAGGLHTAERGAAAVRNAALPAAVCLAGVRLFAVSNQRLPEYIAGKQFR